MQVGLDKEKVNNMDKQFDSYEKNFGIIQFEQPEPNRLTQAIFSDKSVLISFCGSDIEDECTISAISAANYIAMAGYRVALIEPEFSKGTVLNTLIPYLLGKEMIRCGNVDYYTNWDLSRDIYSVDVIIFDYSKMSNEESEFLSKINKVFICSDIEVMNINQPSKLENNSSFKYSILYKDTKQDESLSETIEVFKMCSLELIRLLEITLLKYGIDITNNTEINSVNIINQLNMLNKTELSNTKTSNTKVGRQGVIHSDLNKGKSSLNRITLPVQSPTRLQKSVPIQKPEDPNKMKVHMKTVEQVQRIQSTEIDFEQTQTINAKENKNRNDEVLATKNTHSNKNIEENFNIIKHDKYEYNTLNKDIYRSKTQDDEYNNYNVKNKEKDYNSSKSSRILFANKAIGNKQNTFLNQKKEDKNSILPQWFSLENNVDDEDNMIMASNKSKSEHDDDLDEINNRDYVFENNNKPKKKQFSNQVLCGKETIFITGLKHGCGCSHTGISFAKYILGVYSENICICHKKGAYDLEDEGIAEYTKDTDYDSVFGTNRFIIYDCGILGELNSEQLVELNRCNIKIMVCNGDEKYLGNLSTFIRKLGNSSNEWIFAFNLVTSKEKETMIRKIMDGFKICFIPLHDRDNLPKKVTKMWDSVLKRNLL
jgi:hypothetical protein